MKKFFMLTLVSLSIIVFPLTKAYSAAVTRATPVVYGFNEFAFDLYSQVNNPEKNIIISPYSLSSLMGLLTTGAAGDTQTQLMHVLHLDDIPHTHTVNAELTHLDSTLNTASRCESWMHCKLSKAGKWLGLGGQSQAFTAANALWADEGFSYKKSFLDTLAQNKSAHFYKVNFAKSSEKARETINHWVDKNTHGHIQDLIPKGEISSSTRLVLTNALYFKGMWQFPFKGEETRSKPFRLTNGSQVQVPMMQQQDKFFYAENDQLQMLQLPYAKSTLAMIILLPKAKHSLQAIQQMMNANTFSQLLQESYQQEVILSLPKFTIKSTFNELAKTLQALGLTDAFNEKANFSNITGDALIISGIIQKAMIQVDEAGTVAAAATSTLMMGTAYIPPVEFDANHPFLFIIFDTESKMLLFMGQVVNPQG